MSEKRSEMLTGLQVKIPTILVRF